MHAKKLIGIGGGLDKPAVVALLNDIDTALTAAGTLQTDALALRKQTNVFGTVAAGSGAILESNLEIGDVTDVTNLGANAVLIYPPVGGAIQTGATNAAFSVAAGKTASFKKVTALLFTAVLSA